MRVRVQYEKVAPYVELIPGLWCPATFTVHADEGLPHDVRAEVVPDVAEGLLVVRRLEVSQRPGGESVTSVGLRAVAVGKLVQACIPYLQTRTTDPATGRVTGAGTPWASREDLEHAQKNGADRRTLQRVAHVYRLALLMDGTPTKAVAAAFRVSQATAARWVTKSRQAGFLGPVKGQGKAGARAADPETDTHRVVDSEEES